MNAPKITKTGSETGKTTKKGLPNDHSHMKDHFIVFLVVKKYYRYYWFEA